jgi:hypothetical protein
VFDSDTPIARQHLVRTTFGVAEERNAAVAVQGFGIYVRLLKDGHSSRQMGLKGAEGDVSRWNSRVKVARNFRGIQIESCSDRTLRGYNGFFQVFLTHSALERYLPIINIDVNELEDVLKPHGPEKVVEQFFDQDRRGRLFEFLDRWVNPRLRASLRACREGTCCNVFYLSASVRHIFAHGHLAANSYGMNPDHVAAACGTISDFLLDFMEADFTLRVRDYHRSVVAGSRQDSTLHSEH